MLTGTTTTSLAVGESARGGFDVSAFLQPAAEAGSHCPQFHHTGHCRLVPPQPALGQGQITQPIVDIHLGAGSFTYFHRRLAFLHHARYVPTH